MFLPLVLALLAPHGGPPAFLEARVKPTELELVLTGEQILIGDWLGIPGRAELPLDEDLRRQLMGAAGARLGEVFQLELDGQLLNLEPQELKAYPAAGGIFGLEPAYELKFLVPIQAAPERMDFTWLRLPEPLPAGEQAPASTGRQETVTLHITSRDGVFDLQTLDRIEPQYSWHRPPAPVPIELLPQTLGLEPGPAGSLVWGVPLGLLGIVGLGWTLRRSARVASGPKRLLLRLGVLGLGVLAGQAWLRHFQGEREPPHGELALEIFEGLHQNLYRAFDGATREEVYDLLALSVDGPILDAMYADIYEGLILREEGGAVARVDSVEVLDREFDGELTERLEGAGFGVRWGWRVYGRVVHHAHQHERRERLAARYTVRATEEGWRIAGVEVLEQEREL